MLFHTIKIKLTNIFRDFLFFVIFIQFTTLKFVKLF